VIKRPIDKILQAVKVPLNHPQFFQRLFAFLSKKEHKKHLSDPSIDKVMNEEYDEISRRFDRSQIQESTSARNMYRSRELANLIIDDKGEINTAILPALIEQTRNHLYSLGPNRQYDSKRNEHILKVLELLNSNKEIGRLIKKMSRPITNKIAEDAIRNTLQLPSQVVLSDAYTRRAVLAAWLAYLRQNVGSCFATAPAIMVHDEQPELFLQDLADMLATGRLKRTFGGIEYSVPLSVSWGSGDLKKPFVLTLSSHGIKPEIWFSPGLIAAFEAAEILSGSLTVREKVMQLKEWIEPIIRDQAFRSPYCILTAEQIIRKVLLKVLDLTEEQVNDYENRPRTMIQSSLIMQLAPSQKGLGGIGERCAHFLYQLEVAFNAFKSLADNALLKTWEFTLASFSETKLEFTQWNLYASLGLQTNEPGGIGQVIYQIIQRKIDDLNKELQDQQYDYEMLYTQVKTLESQMRSATTEKEMAWRKIEYQGRVSELYMIQEQRDLIQARSHALVNLYESLYNLYQSLFKDYFQEVYDADLHEVTVGPFDDSPAGYRLVYKHGRSNTSQWTRIKNQNDFIDSLVSFFVATEPQVASLLEKQNVEKDLSEVVTAIINHLKTKEFLESALQRMAAAHRAPLIKDPLNHMDQVEKKPWVYTSGGTMNTLVSCYFRIPEKPFEVAKWVESEVELLVFLADTLKHLPPKLMEPYLKGIRSDMLMQSPTHAFILKPTLFPFKNAWANEEFTYTSIRDLFVKPAEQFIDNMVLSDQMIQYLVQAILEKVPENFQPRFKSVFNSLSGPMGSIVFRDYIVEAMEQDRGLRYGNQTILSSEQIDSLLYSSLPLFPNYELKDRLHKILILLPHIGDREADEILSLLDQIPFDRTQEVVSAHQLREITKALILLHEQKTFYSHDVHMEISQATQKLGFSMPTPIIFADTNWIKDEFAFIVNPGTGRLELWRVDYIGTQGHPMANWKQWVDGSRPDLKWGVYVKPYEYGQV
jgi:hypothetical protein